MSVRCWSACKDNTVMEQAHLGHRLDSGRKLLRGYCAQHEEAGEDVYAVDSEGSGRELSEE